MGQKKKAGSGKVRTGSMNLFRWRSKIFRKEGWSEGWGIKRIEMEKILGAKN